MKALTIEAIHSQVPRSFALMMLQDYAVSDPETFALTLYNWLRARLRIVDEFEELLQSPLVLIDSIMKNGWAAADCDCCAMLGASILASVGALCRFTAIEMQADGSFGHVFTEFKFPRIDYWQPFDLTLRWGMPDNIPEPCMTVDIIS